MEVGGQRHTVRPFYSRERPGTHCVGGWMDPQDRSGRMRKMSHPPAFDPRTFQSVAISFPGGVIGTFHWHNLSRLTMALESTHSLTEMSPKNISGGKAGRCVGLTTLPPLRANCLEIWEPQHTGTLRACAGIAYIFTVTLISSICFTWFQPTCASSVKHGTTHLKYSHFRMIVLESRSFTRLQGRRETLVFRNWKSQ